MTGRQFRSAWVRSPNVLSQTGNTAKILVDFFFGINQPVYVKVSGVWKQADGVFVKVGGVWKSGEVKANIDNLWK